MRQVDTALFEIASLLDDKTEGSFEHPLSQEVKNSARAFLNRGLSRNVTRLSLSNWAVRLFVHDKQYVVGRTNNYETALRFADMAAMFFWPYRKRQQRRPVDAELNFSVDQALRDLKEEYSVQRILGMVENLFEERGLLDHKIGLRLRTEGSPLTKIVPKTRRSIRIDHEELIKRVVKLEEGQHQIVEALALLRERIGTGICKPENV